MWNYIRSGNDKKMITMKTIRTLICASWLFGASVFAASCSSAMEEMEQAFELNDDDSVQTIIVRPVMKLYQSSTARIIITADSSRNLSGHRHVAVQSRWEKDRIRWSGYSSFSEFTDD